MLISYNRLWKLMIDLNMNKTQLRKVTGVSTNVIAKLSKNDYVSMESLLRICKALHCDLGDIVEVIDETYQSRMTEYSFRNESNLLRVAESEHGEYRNK